jgi:hypothetical protein
MISIYDIPWLVIIFAIALWRLDIISVHSTSAIVFFSLIAFTFVYLSVRRRSKQ